jgi:cyanophycinase
MAATTRQGRFITVTTFVEHHMRFFHRTAACTIVCLIAAAWALATGPAPASQVGNYRDRNFDYFVSGDPARSNTAHTEFGLALMGGGGTVDAAFEFIAKRAGGGHIVILRAVSDDSYDPDDGDYGEKFFKQWGPVTSAETIVFHNRDAASDPRVIAALRAAAGIFIAGGDQGNYIRYWKGTPVQDALNAHVQANRPIGGSSAGLAILGHYSYTSLDGGSMESKNALADPFNSGMTLESDFLHYRWLESVMTDTHFSARSRLGRLISFLARLNADNPSARVFGIGVDEHTAVLIGADGIGKLAPGSAGSVWVVLPPDRAASLAPAQPLSMDNIRLLRMDQGSSIDLGSREVRHPGATATISIRAGRLTHESIASKILMREKAPPDEG